MNRRSDDEAHGCGPRELAILERTDAGVDDATVAAELHVAESWVRQCRQTYSGSWRENDRIDAATREACRRHALALAVSGGRYL